MFRSRSGKWKIFAVVVLILLAVYFVWHGLNIDPANRGLVK